ncbi:MAG: hypothetical protein ACLR7U_04025 [Ruthenibacterium lactatiformans]
MPESAIVQADSGKRTACCKAPDNALRYSLVGTHLSGGLPGRHRHPPDMTNTASTS